MSKRERERDSKRVELDRLVERAGDERLGQIAKAHAGGARRVLGERVHGVPLLGVIDAHVRAGTGQVAAAEVERHVAYLVLGVELDGLEVLELAQVPQLDARVLATRGQVVAVLGEGETRDGGRVARKVGQVALALQVPDLDERVARARAEYETVRVELSARESDGRRGVLARRAHLDEHAAGANVREGPVLVRRARQQVVAERMQRYARHARLVHLEHLRLLAARHRPRADGGVRACRYNRVLLLLLLLLRVGSIDD